jgi:outer membrane murein-binding lipoprotein Lpp
MSNGFISMRNMQNNVIIVIAVIVGLAIGVGGTYVYTSGQVAPLQTSLNTLQTQVTTLSAEKTQLESQVTAFSAEKIQLQTQISTINSEKTSLQTQIGTLTSQNTDLANQYNSLVATIDAMHSSDWTQSVTYNITAGTDKTWTFVADKYGIIWEAVIGFSGDYVSMAHYYWYKGERFFVGSSGMSLTSVQDFRPTHGYQQFLYGTIKLNVSKDANTSNRIWVSCNILTQLPDISRGGDAYLELV